MAGISELQYEPTPLVRSVACAINIAHQCPITGIGLIPFVHL